MALSNRLVMFDLDGTLLDTAGEIADSVNRTLSEAGQPEVALDQVRDWIGHGTGWLMKTAWTSVAGEPDDDQWPSVMGRFMHHYLECCGTRSTPYPGVVDALTRLDEMGVITAVVTNKESRYTQRVLRAHGLDTHFDLVISGDTYTVKKPDPAVIYNCLKDAEADIERSLFVGDSSIDVRCAKAAGIPVWAVPYGYNMGRPILESAPDRLIDSIADVLEFFKGKP